MTWDDEGRRFYLWDSISMPLPPGFRFKLGCCLSSAEAARKSDSERKPKQHVWVRGTVCFGKKRQVTQKNTLYSRWHALQVGSASVLGAWARMKQHAQVKWHDSPSSMGTDTHDLCSEI